MANHRRNLLAITILMTAVAALLALVFLGGGGKQTVASRSAAAFREAQRKGKPAGESAHGHGALSPQTADSAPGAAHRQAEMTESEHAGHAGATTSDRGSATGSSASRHPHAKPQSQRKPATDRAAQKIPHEAMQAEHGDMPQAAPETARPHVEAVEARPGQPATTLRPDPLDQPVPTSVLDARRSVEMSQEMASGEHGMQHGATSYHQLDAGRDSVTTVQEGESAAPQHDMQHGSPPPTPTPPPATKKPPPSKRKPPVEPTHPPHHPGADEAASYDREEWR